ncbi:hypothetical protein [Nocardioides sp. LHG3406-4]|uniref:hypothetical protein n=1 Tax=Nocardioides sp. LHG3406-4 TaxID=2804575 RepID=UPI003CF626D6
MPLRKPATSRTLVGAILLSAALSTSCGFNMATDRYYTPTNGANDRSGVVDVLSAMVVSGESGEGVFIASLSNNSTTKAVELDGIASTKQETLSAPEVTPVEIAPGALVNLAESETPISVTGDFEAGYFVPVEVSFSNGETASMKVPVVVNCGIYSDISGVPAGPEDCPVAEVPEGEH